MELTVNSFIRSCRTCLSTKREVETIFDSNYNGENLNAILMFLVPINVLRDDGLSDKICLDCKQRLIDAYEFRKMVIQSNENAKAFNLLNEKYKKPSINLPDIKIEEEYELIEDEDDGILEYEIIEHDNLIDNIESKTEEDFIMETVESESCNEEPVEDHIECLNYPATEEDFVESYNCEECGMMFDNSDILLEHLKQDHMKTKIKN